MATRPPPLYFRMNCSALTFRLCRLSKQEPGSMPTAIPADSVGLVSPQVAHFAEPLTLACGRTLADYQLIYETYGELNAARSNAVLICHAPVRPSPCRLPQRGRSQARLDSCIGPGKAIDTDRFFVVSLNNPAAATAPPAPAAPTRPPANPTARTSRSSPWRTAQPGTPGRSARHQPGRSVGGSLRHAGPAVDHQLSRAGASLPGDCLGACCRRSRLQRSGTPGDPLRSRVPRRAFPEMGVIPKRGLMLARMVGHITYLSDDAMGTKFGRGLKSEKLNYDFNSVEFVESPALPGRGVLALRRQHLSADDQGAGLFRPGRGQR